MSLRVSVLGCYDLGKGETHLTGNMRITLPDLCSKLVLSYQHWLHEVTSTGVDTDVSSRWREENFGEGPDTLAPSSQKSDNRNLRNVFANMTYCCSMRSVVLISRASLGG